MVYPAGLYLTENHRKAPGFRHGDIRRATKGSNWMMTLLREYFDMVLLH